MKNIWRLFELVPEYKGRLAKVVATNSLLGLAGLATPYVFKNLVDLVIAAVAAGSSPEISNRILLSLGLLLGIGIVSSLADYIGERISDVLFVDMLWEIRKKVFKHLTTVSIDYYEQNRAGETLERVNTGTFDISQWAHALSDGFLGTIIMMILVLVFLWIKLPLVGLLMTLSLCLNFYWAILKVVKSRPIRRRWHQQAEKGTGEISETISHIATVRSFAQEGYKFDRYSSQIDEYRQLRLSQAKIEWSTNFYRGLLNAVTIAASVGLVAWGAIHGRYSTGDILLVSLYFQRIQSNVGPLSRLFSNTGDMETSAERIVEVLDVKPTVTDAPNAKDLTELQSIEFKNVSFHYPGKSKQVLDNISFTLKAGKTLALVGPSGVGKTTITKLLLRFYAPTSGTILVNNQPIETFTQGSIRQLLGVVMQDVALFNDTVKENLRFANPNANDDEIIAAAKTAHADVFINKLSDQYETLVGERGIKLSGGEKQRIAIARAILRDPQLIILDEATSALDSQSESYVQDGLRQLMAKRTAVVIAHRLSTVMRADQIIVLQDGKVLETGNHRSLLKKQGLYARLFSMQTANKTVEQLFG